MRQVVRVHRLTSVLSQLRDCPFTSRMFLRLSEESNKWMLIYLLALLHTLAPVYAAMYLLDYSM